MLIENELKKDINLINENIYYLEYELLGSLFIENILNDLFLIKEKYNIEIELNKYTNFLYLLNKNYELINILYYLLTYNKYIF